MALPALEPDPRLIGSPLLLIPLVLLGHAHDVAAVSALMERDFEEKGLADSATALLLNQAFSIRVEHARYLTMHDLCALTAMQYDHAGLGALWSAIEAALLSPQREERIALDDGVVLHHAAGRIAIEGPRETLTARQAAAVLAAHGLRDGR